MLTLCYIQEQRQQSQHIEFGDNVLDSVAQRFVTGKSSAIKYCNELAIGIHLAESQSIFVFGDDNQRSLGLLKIIIPTPKGMRAVLTDLVPADILFLRGLDLLDRFMRNVLTVQNQLQVVQEEWVLILTRKRGHIYPTWTFEYAIHYNRFQLRELHLHFMYLSVEKRFNLLKRAFSQKLTLDTLDILKHISRLFHACQVYSSRPITFQVAFPDEVVFNKSIRLDLMYLDGKPVLSIADVCTNYSTERFLAAENTQAAWGTFLNAWVTKYVGYPDDILTDQGSVFRSESWRSNFKRS